MLNGVPVPGSAASRTFTDQKVWAERMSAKGKEGADGGLLSDTRSAMWLLSWRSYINADCEIVDENGVVWGVDGVEEIENRSFSLLTCTARPEN